jgi:putative transposase
MKKSKFTDSQIMAALKRVEGGAGGTGAVPGDWQQLGDVSQMAGQVWRHGHLHDGPDEGIGTGERPALEEGCRGTAEGRDPQGGHGKKVVRPSQRRETAQCAVAQRGVSICLACELFTVSVTCYRYVAKRRAENEEMADWLIRLTDNQRTWGFG